MQNNSSDEENARLERILSRLSEQQKVLDKLNSNYSMLTSEWLISSAKAEAINQAQAIEDRISKKIANYFSTAKLIGTFITLIIGLLGYLGIQHAIETSVAHGFSKTMEQRVSSIEEEILAKSKEKLAAADKLYVDTHHKLGQVKNDLIVLQTDFGAGSSYMGELKGAIYHINPNARIDVITDEVQAFNTYEAAWILSKVNDFYPKNAIFIAITGDVGVDASPVIARNKETGHIFIGYANGVFDLVKPDDGFDDTYRVNLKALKAVLEQNKYGIEFNLSDKAAQEKESALDVNTNLYLGFIAGALSIFPMPWEENYTEIKKISWVEAEILEKKAYEVTLKKIEPKLLPAKSMNSVIIQGTIMNVDRFGNVNTNISKKFLDDMLEKENKNLKLDDNVIVSVGIYKDEEDTKKIEFEENVRVLKLKSIPYKPDYSDVKPNEPLLTIKNGKVQLAINQGNFSESKNFIIDNSGIEKDSYGKYVRSGMVVAIVIESMSYEHEIIN